MSDQQIEIKAVTRKIGKHHSRSLRNSRMIPAVLYGPKTENMNLAITELEVTKYSARRFENEIFTLSSEDKGLNGLRVLKKDVTIHPVTRRPVHVDFYVPDMTQKVKVEVEVKFEGTAKGTKEGGILNILQRKVEIECLPASIPSSFSVDISNLGLGDVLHVSDLNIAETEALKVWTSKEETLATISQAKEEKKADPEAEAAAAAAPTTES